MTTERTVAPNNGRDEPRVFEADPVAALLISTLGDDFDYGRLEPGEFEEMIEDLRKELDESDDGEDLEAAAGVDDLGPGIYDEPDVEEDYDDTFDR